MKTRKITYTFRLRCGNCEKLGVIDSANIYIMCNECAHWKDPLQEKPGQ